MEVYFLIMLFILGACFGSFLCCQARRLHLNAKKGSKHKKLPSRSVCLHCHYQLKWYDNIPILSWLALRGKCRKCHHKIGAAEIISEAAVALGLLLLGTSINIATADPLTWATFIAATIFTLVLAFLAIYDGLYGELPVSILTISIICAIIILTLRIWASISTSGFSYTLIVDPLAAVAILGGLYLLLYLISHGRWVGDGDWILATAIAIALAHPWLALISLFVANLLACLYAFASPGRARRKRIHLGPFLVIAFTITYSFAAPLLTLLPY